MRIALPVVAAIAFAALLVAADVHAADCRSVAACGAPEALGRTRLAQLGNQNAPAPSTGVDIGKFKRVILTIVGNNNATEDKSGQADMMKVDFEPGDILVWRFAVHSCFQKVTRAKLSDLDLRAARILDHKVGMYLELPCKRGAACVREDYGAGAWPVLTGPTVCKDRKIVTRKDSVFRPGAVPATHRQELEAVLRR